MSRFNLIVLAAVMVFLIVLAVQPVEAHLAGLSLVDDGFYYLGYARHLALGDGPTFDGRVMTNGVQPLWALLLTGLAVLESDPVRLMQASLILAAGLVAGSVLALNRVLRRFFGTETGGLALLFYLALIATPQLVLTGMETPVNLASLCLALAGVLAIRRAAFWPTVGAGLLVGLACLARVDNLILTPAFALLLAWSNGSLHAALAPGVAPGVAQGPRRFGPIVRSTLILALPVIVLFGGYLLLNLSAFDRPLPVSGDVKAAHQAVEAAALGGRFSPAYLGRTTLDALAQIPTIFNHYLNTLLLSFSPWTLLARLGLALGIGAGIGWLLLRRKPRPAIRLGLTRADGVLIAGCGALVAAHVWAFHFQLGARYAFLNWYYAPEYIFLTLAAGGVLHLMGKVAGDPRTVDRLLRLGLAACLLVSSLVMLGQFLGRSNPLQPLLAHYRAVEWANQHVPPEDVIGSFNAGVVGYFSVPPVINLDGLMNDAEILAVVRGEASLVDYLERHEIGWIMDYVAGTWTQTDGQPFHGIPADRLEVAHAQPFTNYGFVDSTFYVLRYRPQAVSEP